MSRCTLTVTVLRLIAINLVFCTPALAAENQVDRKKLERKFGLILVDTGGAGDWVEQETLTLNELLHALPQDLATVATRAPGGKVRLVKNYQAPRNVDTHLAPWSLNFQVSLFLHDAGHLTKKISTKTLNDLEQAQYILYFKRKIVHHLLHLFDTEKQQSHTQAWRSISGWRYREYFGFRLPLVKEALNQDPRNYTREEGLLGPEEDFASFGEFFFVDTETNPDRSIKCRISEKYDYFSRLFPDYVPHAGKTAVSCQLPDSGFLDDITFLDPITRRPIAMGPFNIDTVEDFELLYATPGVNDAAEIAGHLILRVKMRNNPEAERLGIENPNDLVISFLADTESGRPAAKKTRTDAVPTECRKTWFDFGQAVRDDQDAMRSILQALKGLSGGFLTVYDRQTLYQAVKTYTIDQDRNLLRFKLNLSKEQKKSLIHRLYAAKRNFKSKYYFFDRNCASILVQIIGEGIGDREVAEFDPFVVPPNSLVALMIRKGLATQTFPSFYSYRKKGYIAQEEIQARVQRDASRRNQLLSTNESTRLKAWEVLKRSGTGNLLSAREFYQLATLGQDAELSFLDRSQRCENYTSKVTQFLRRAQKDLVKTYGPTVVEGAVDTNVLISERFQGEEALDARTGSQNTQLSSVASGWVKDQSTGASGYFFGYAVHRQDAGSVASQAMQRGTSVKLGDLRFEKFFSTNEMDDAFRWSLTGLEIRKFKERLYNVPSYFSEYGKLGLGLSVLKLRKDSEENIVHSTLAGGALLFNILSSRLYLDYFFVSIGADADVVWRKSRTAKFVPEQTAVIIPVRGEGLLTFGATRLWQLRAAHQVRIKYIGGSAFQEQSSTGSLQYRLPENFASEFLVSAGAARFVPFTDTSARKQSQVHYSLGIEWNRW